jgi:hypothetical protein
VPPCFGA